MANQRVPAGLPLNHQLLPLVDSGSLVKRASPWINSQDPSNWITNQQVANRSIDWSPGPKGNRADSSPSGVLLVPVLALAVLVLDVASVATSEITMFGQFWSE